MKRKLSVLLIVLIIFVQICMSVFPVTAMELSAESSCLVDKDGNVIYENNAHARMPMASTTKIMTAIVAIENLELDHIITVADEAIGVEGSSMYLQKNEQVCIKDLLHALMLQSANDAAVALACAVSGSVESFAQLMNAKADELKLHNTHFVNPHGLDDDQHYTTAYELALITAYAMQNKTFADIVSTFKYTYSTDVRSGIFVNHNKLLYMMEDCVGVKTGYTKRTGRCLVSATEDNGLLLIGVTLNAPNDWQDHKLMQEYGKDLYEQEYIAGNNELCFALDVINGTKKDILLTNVQELSIWYEKKNELTVVTELPQFLYAPVEKGEICGYVQVYSGDELVASSEIIASESCDEIRYPGFFETVINKIKDFIGELFNG